MKKYSTNSNAQVLSLLGDSVEMEVHLGLQYHVDRRFLKFKRFPLHRKLSSFGEKVEEFTEQLMSQVLFLGGIIQYESGTITSQDPSGSPSDSVKGIFEQELLLEESICEKYEDFIITAMEAKNDEVRNLLEHLVKWHHSQVSWLRAQLDWIGDLGIKDYIGAKL